MIYMITNFNLQGVMPLVSVALLMRLDSQYVCTDLLHFLFLLCHSVETKYDSLSELKPTQGSMAGTSIKCLKW
jgi:hypothetical protein